MKVSTLAVLLISAHSTLAWSLFGKAPNAADAPAPVPAQDPTAVSTANDPFAPVATPQAEAIPLDNSFSSAASVASSTLSSVLGSEATATNTRARPIALPTPITFFNGDKPTASDPYSGFQYALFSGKLVFRPALFYNELLAIAAIVLIGLFGMKSKNSNWGLAKTWMQEHTFLLEEAFSSVDVGSGRYLKEVDGCTYIGWASGRKGLKALRIKLLLKPRADIFLSLYEMIRKLFDFTYQTSQDIVQFEFLFDSAAASSGEDEFIVAIVDKAKMAALRNDRWDVNAFSTLTESSKNVLPSQLAIFTETNAILDGLLKNDQSGLGEWLNGSGEGQEYFQSLVISDIAGHEERPDDTVLAGPTPLTKDRRMILTLRLPPGSKSKQTVPALTLAINLADALAQNKIANESVSKLKKRRTEIVETVIKTYKASLLEELKEEAAKKKKALDDAKYNALSPEAQKKKDDLEKKRKEKKMMQKQAASGKRPPGS